MRYAPIGDKNWTADLIYYHSLSSHCCCSSARTAYNLYATPFYYPTRSTGPTEATMPAKACNHVSHRLSRFPLSSSRYVQFPNWQYRPRTVRNGPKPLPL